MTPSSKAGPTPLTITTTGPADAALDAEPDVVPYDVIRLQDEDGSELDRLLPKTASFIIAEHLGEAAGLSPHEGSVLGLVVSGLSNQQIADRVYLSINSVKTYISSTYRKGGRLVAPRRWRGASRTGSRSTPELSRRTDVPG